MQYAQAGRLLRRNHSNALPRYIISLDAETNRTPLDKCGRRFDHSFRLATAVSGRFREGEITNTKLHRLPTHNSVWRLIEKIAKPNFTTWVVAHNALFDFIVSGLTERFERAELAIDAPRAKRKREDNLEDNPHCAGLAVIDSPPTILGCRIVSSSARIVILDSMNWFPVSLKMLGKSVGLDKLPMPDWTDDNEAWYQYCQRDSLIVFKAFIELMHWTKANDMGMFRYTAASQAMAAYRHRFMTHPIAIHDNAEVKALERSSYFGGRTECWFLGEINQELHHLDVTSLFPSVMLGNSFPRALNRSEIRQEYCERLPEIEYHNAIAEVELEAKEPLYPFRRKENTVYPIGHFRTVLVGPELLQARLADEITAVKSWAEYQTAPIFDAFVSTLWAMRLNYKQEGNSLYDEFTKRLLNSLYGKWAQLAPAWQNVGGRLDYTPFSQWSERESDTGQLHHYRSIGWQLQRYTDRLELPNTFPAISAFVTAHARIRMNRLRKIAGHDNIYYQGVDCLITTSTGRNLLVSSGEVQQNAIGKLRHCDSYTNGWIGGCFDYRLGDKIVISGIERDPMKTETGILLQRRMLTSQLLFEGKAPVTVIESLTPWQRSGRYTKGTVQTNGQVIPLELAGQPVQASERQPA